MAKLTVLFGVLLVVLGGATYLWTGSQYPTALIPMWFGLVLTLCGVLANAADPRRRMLWMHIAVTMGTIGFLGAATKMVIALVNSHERGVNPIAFGAQGAMSLLCAIFVGMCVRSFVAARRERVTA